MSRRSGGRARRSRLATRGQHRDFGRNNRSPSKSSENLLGRLSIVPYCGSTLSMTTGLLAPPRTKDANPRAARCARQTAIILEDDDSDSGRCRCVSCQFQSAIDDQFLRLLHRLLDDARAPSAAIPRRTMAVSEAAFKAIAALVSDKSTPVARPSTRAEKLRLYGLYKRATTESSARPARPGMFNVDGRLKWDAWKAEDGRTAEEAREAYVELAKELIGGPVEEVLAAE